MHVDMFIDNTFGEHRYARWFLLLARLPAVHRIEFEDYIKPFKLFCTYGGVRYRCTGASRLGDVWLTTDFEQDTGYQERVEVEECFAWSDSPQVCDDCGEPWKSKDDNHCDNCETGCRVPATVTKAPPETPPEALAGTTVTMPAEAYNILMEQIVVKTKRNKGLEAAYSKMKWRLEHGSLGDRGLVDKAEKLIKEACDG